MRDNNDTDFVLPFSSGDVTLEDPQGRTVAADPTRQLLGSVEFRLSLEDVKGLIELSKAVERMQEAVWDIPVAIGPLVGHGEGGRIRSIPTYQIATGPFFHNLTDVTLDGEQFSFEQEWTDVTIWDIGRGITFRTSEPDGGYSLAVGLAREDLELHLEAVADPTFGR